MTRGYNKERLAYQLSIFGLDHDHLINHVYPRNRAYQKHSLADLMQLTPDDITPGEVCMASLRLQNGRREPDIGIGYGWVRIMITGSDGLLKSPGEERLIRFNEVPRSDVDERNKRLLIPIEIATHEVDDLYPWILIRVTQAAGYRMACMKRRTRAVRRTFDPDWHHNKLEFKLYNFRAKNNIDHPVVHPNERIPGTVMLNS